MPSAQKRLSVSLSARMMKCEIPKSTYGRNCAIASAGVGSSVNASLGSGDWVNVVGSSGNSTPCSLQIVISPGSHPTAWQLRHYCSHSGLNRSSNGPLHIHTSASRAATSIALLPAEPTRIGIIGSGRGSQYVCSTR